MLVNVNRVAIATITFLATAHAALADVTPDPTDPTGPYGIAALAVLVVGGIGYLFYRRRRK